MFSIHRSTGLKNIATQITLAAFLLPAFIVGALGAEKSPTPGKWTIVPDRLVAGQTCPLEIHYLNETDLPPGTIHQVWLEPLSVKELVLAQPSTDLAIAPIPGVPLANVSLKTYQIAGVGTFRLEFTFPNGAKPGEGFALKVGNKAPDGSIMALVDPNPATDLSFETYTIFPGGDPKHPVLTNWVDAGWGKDLPKVNVVGGSATNIRVFGPTLAQAGRPFSVKIAVVDNFDNTAVPAYVGKIGLEADRGVTGLPSDVTFAAGDDCAKKIEGLSIAEPGVYRLRAHLPGSDKVMESNPIVVRKDVPENIYWGCLHNHVEYSECWGQTPAEFHRFCRDIAGMDYDSLSDHKTMMPEAGGDISLTSRLLSWRWGKKIDALDAWKDSVGQAQKNNQPGTFVALIGYEWSSMDSGHYNVYFDDADLAHLDKYFLPRWSDFAFDMRRLLGKSDNTLFIPHKHAGVFPYLVLDDDARNVAGQLLSPDIEVYSDWGESYYPFGVWSPMSLYGGLRTRRGMSYLWALADHFVLGVLGDSDCHAGWPGRRTAAGIATQHKHPTGLTAASTSDFTRDGIMNAYRQRKVYATTGARIFLDVRAGDAKMDDFYYTDKPFAISVEVAGTDAIRSIELHNGPSILAKKDLGGKRDGTVVFDNLQPTDNLLGYTAAVIQNDENRAFSSPIWVRRDSVPDLAWTTDDKGEVYLVNKGKGPASNVDVMIAKGENPFTPETIEGQAPADTEGSFIAWTLRKTDQRAIFYVRAGTYGTDAKIAMHGVKSYYVEPNRDLWSEGVLNNDDKGNVEFVSVAPVKVVKDAESSGGKAVEGVSIQADIDPTQPAYADVTLNKSLKVYFGDQRMTTDHLRIALNGRTSQGMTIDKVVPQIGPGEKIDMGKSVSGTVYSADPENKIAEADETNNSLTAK